MLNNGQTCGVKAKAWPTSQEKDLAMFIDAIKLRINAFSTRAALARADKKINIMCRRCHAQPEILGHILGLCQHTKGLRIKRHDEVKNFLAQKLSTSNQVFAEPSIKIGDDLYKPDIVVKNEERLRE
jgi:ribosomal protein L40E